MKTYVPLLYLTLLHFVLAEESTQDESTSGESTEDVYEQQIDQVKLYRNLFKKKRSLQVDAIKGMKNLGTYDKQYDLAERVMKSMAEIIDVAYYKLTEQQFAPDDPFPKDKDIREAFAQLLENTAFFGELLLREPDISHALLKRNKEWELTFKRAVGFCEQSRMFEGADAKLLRLMSMELGIIDKDPDYENPYAKETQEKKKDSFVDGGTPVGNINSSDKLDMHAEAEGQKSNTEGQNSNAEGQNPNAEDQKSNTEGQNSNAEGQNSNADGQRSSNPDGREGLNVDSDTGPAQTLTIDISKVSVDDVVNQILAQTEKLTPEQIAKRRKAKKARKAREEKRGPKLSAPQHTEL